MSQMNVLPVSPGCGRKKRKNNDNWKNLLSMKVIMKVELAVHKRKAKVFYDTLRTSRETDLVLSFDCQKNQVIPKIPDQAAYYYAKCIFITLPSAREFLMTNCQKTEFFPMFGSKTNIRKALMNLHLHCITDCSLLT